ncbi:MAG: hypothetical protein HRT94_00490 [Alphaproteobacteria bacterium]|nr:hypothetical protein [Alphaproteobacteria bacterium]
MFDSSPPEDKARFKQRLKEMAIESFGEESKVLVQESSSISEGYDVLFSEPVAVDDVSAFRDTLTERFGLSEREWGYYLDDKCITCSGIGITGQASSFLSRLTAN